MALNLSLVSSRKATGRLLLLPLRVSTSYILKVVPGAGTPVYFSSGSLTEKIKGLTRLTPDRRLEVLLGRHRQAELLGAVAPHADQGSERGHASQEEVARFRCQKLFCFFASVQANYVTKFVISKFSTLT
jgi:hypothetical protein